MLRFSSLMLVCFFGSPVAGQLQLHVSTKSHIHGNGTELDPFASISEARDRIRELRSSGELDKVNVEVLIHAGRYELPSTLEYKVEDSGEPAFPVVYRGVGGEVIVSGGVELTHWQPLTRANLLERLPKLARKHVISIDLRSIGIDPGSLQPRRLHQKMASEAMELYHLDTPLPRAGWPNEGWARTNIASHAGQPSKARQWTLNRVIASEDRNDAWAHGFWEHDWSDSFEPISIDANSTTATLRSNDALSPKNVRDQARYRIENVLCELDSPGEWYVDRTSGLLLFWPTTDTGQQPTTAAVLDTVVSIYDVQNVQFEGIRFESARSMVIEIAGGCDVNFENCKIGQAGQVAVHIFRGTRHRITDCDLFCTGSSAVRIEGGDRRTLTPGEHFIENCSVRDFCTDYRSGRAAIAVYGVGNVVRKNHIHSGSDSAIALFGNEHLVEHNHIHHVCQEADDCAAIHLSYDPTYRGNVIRKNYIHDLGGFSKTGVFGIYLDDLASGTTVADNYLRNTIRGIAIGGGRDNRIENNVIDGALAALQIDARGTTWARHRFRGEHSEIRQLFRNAMQDAPVFAEHYPDLVRMLNDDPAIPKGNVLRSNTFSGVIGIDIQGLAENFVRLENNSQRSPSDLVGTEVEAISSTLADLGIDLNSLNVHAVQQPRAKIFVKTDDEDQIF